MSIRSHDRSTTQPTDVRSPRRFVCLSRLVGVVLALFSGVLGGSVDVGAQTEPNDEPRAVTVEDLERRGEIETQIAAAEARFAMVADELRAARLDEEAAQARLEQIDDLLEINARALDDTRLARVQPDRLRTLLAIMVYVRGDPTTTELVDVLRTGAIDADGQAQRVVFSEVTGDTLRELAALDDTARRLRSVAADLGHEIERVRAERDERGRQAIELAAEQARLTADLADLRGVLDQLVALEAQISAEEAAAAADDALAARTAAGEPDVDGTSASPVNGPRHPLSGELTVAPVSRPALAVKIDNSPRARPQSGINQADLVIEEVVEGGLTRFVAIFHSTAADPIGPIRSARTSDIRILANLASPLFASSGGNPATLGAVAQSSLSDVSINRVASAYRRLGGRPAPHNLYSSTQALWASAPATAEEPPKLFVYRPPDVGPSERARPVAGAAIDFGAETVRYRWDGDGWARTVAGSPTIDAAGVAVVPENVVVLFIDYGTSPADARSPEAVVAGRGTAWIFTSGQLVEGTWTRPTDADLTVLEDSNGNTIALTPGRTWMALAPIGSGSIIS